jgi:tetratricopeptide (TPR) repeat protein
MPSITTFRLNPYIIGPPITDPAKFFGRDDLFGFIRQMLYSQANVALLHGQRRIGKSSVLAQIPLQSGMQEFVFVLFDLQKETGRPLNRILFDLTTKIAGSLPGVDVPPIEAMENNDLEQGAFASVVLPRVQTLLGDKRLVLLLDEFDVLDDRANRDQTDPFFGYLKNIVTQHKSVKVIAVIGRRLDDLVELQSLFREAATHAVGLLDRQAATQLIKKPAEGVLTFGDDAVNAILELSAGHPYFTQLLAYVLFERAQDEGRGSISRSDVEAAIPKAIERGEAGLVWFRSALNVAERVIFSVIAEFQERQGRPSQPQTRMDFWKGVEEILREVGAARTELLVHAVNRLAEWGFVEADGGGYRVKIELVRRWLITQHPVRHVIRELEKADARAIATYKQAKEARSRGDAQSAIALYEEALKADPNHFSALIELAKMQLDSGNYEDAVSLYERVYKVDPMPLNAENFAKALVGAGVKLMRGDRFEQAAAMGQRALEVEPDNEEAALLRSDAEAAARRALAARNPFVVGGVVPPQQFVGRSTGVSQVIHAVSTGGHVAIFGESTMGKSSLLHYVASPISLERHGVKPDPFVFVNVDCPSLELFSPVKLWEYVAGDMEKRFNSDAQIVEAAAQLRATAIEQPPNLSSLLRVLATRGRKVVLLLDDFDVALAVREDYSQEDVQRFLRYLRSVMTDRASISIVIATRKSPPELVPSPTAESPWYNYYIFVRLKPFDDSEVAELAAQLPARFAPEPGVKEWARLISGDWPYLLQAAFSVYFSLRSQDRPFEMADATAEVASTAETIFPMIWEDCSKQEQMLLTLLALRDWERRTEAAQAAFREYDLVLSQYDPDLENMQNRGLVVSHQRDRYVLRSSLMAWWIIKRIEGLRQEELAQHSLVFFQFLNQHRATELQGGLMKIWEQAKRFIESFGRTGRFQTGIRKIREQKAAFRDIEKWGRPLPEEKYE